LSHGVEEQADPAAPLLGLNINRRTCMLPAEEIFDAAKFVKGGIDGAWVEMASNAGYDLMIRDR
jgi:hypothetical protein